MASEEDESTRRQSKSDGEHEREQNRKDDDSNASRKIRWDPKIDNHRCANQCDEVPSMRQHQHFCKLHLANKHKNAKTM